MALSLKKITTGSISKKSLDWLSLSIIPTVTFIAIALITALVIAPRVGAILAIRKVITEKNAKVSKLATKLKTLESLKISDIQSDLRIARRSLPDQKDVISAVVGIQRLASETGVDITLVNTTPGAVSEEEAPESKKEQPKPQAEEDLGVKGGKKKTPPSVPQTTPQSTPQNQIDINLTISAKEGGEQNFFEKARNFLEKLFKSRRVFSLKEVTFAPNIEAEIPSLDLTISLSSFYQPLPKELGPVDAPISQITNEERQLLLKLEEFEVVSEKIFPKTSGKSNPFR